MMSFSTMTRHFVRTAILFVLGGVCWCGGKPICRAAETKSESAREPVAVGTFPENEASVVRLPDGSLQVFYNQRGEYVGSVTSRDDGRTWSAPRKEFAVAGETAHAVQVLLDKRQELQVYYLVIQRGGRKIGVDLFLDLWQATTSDGRTRWNEPRMVYHGAVGALRGLAVTTSGRIVIPFSTADPTRKAGPPIGYFYTTSIASDDDGATWQVSPSRLTAPCTDGYNGGNYGAVEPTIVELRDGRLWMLIRTQTGRRYESFSSDQGSTWRDAVPSRFYGSNSPAMLRRLNDGRLLVVWNNAQVGPKHEGQGVYGGRDALHAALSDDDGRTWRGYREVYRDPTRHGEGVELRNDRGTAYSDAQQAGDGWIVLATGQGEGRRAILRFHPDWLLETHREDDFSDGLAGWHAQQEVGPAQRFFRKRRYGAQLVKHPDDPKRNVLCVAKRDEEPGAGAMWNFPQAARGELQLRVRVGDDFRGGTIALTDRLFLPTDDAASLGWVRLRVERGVGQSQAAAADTIRLTPNRWHDVRLRWDTTASNSTEACRVSLDGGPGPPLTTHAAAPSGLSYLSLRSTADEVDPQGLLIERVAVDVEP